MELRKRTSQARIECRKELIRRTRELLASEEWEQHTFSSTVTYSEIRPHLTEVTIRSIEGDKITVRAGRGGNVIKTAVLDDIVKKRLSGNLCKLIGLLFRSLSLQNV